MKKFFLVLLLVAVFSEYVEAAVIVDTGLPIQETNGGPVVGLGAAGQFEIQQHTKITAIEAYIGSVSGSATIKAVIYQGIDSPDLYLSNKYFEQFFQFSAIPWENGWHGPKNLELVLTPGFYWFALETPHTVSGVFFATAPNIPPERPLAKYAWVQYDNSVKIPTYLDRDLAFATRIYGEEINSTPVPEPMPFSLLLISFLCLWRFRMQALQVHRRS